MSRLWILVYMLGPLPVLSPVVSGSLSAVNPSDIEAPPRYPNPDLPDIVCLMCSPGTYLQRHCTHNLTNSVCKECEVGKFSINYNRAESCETCRTEEKGCPIRNAHLVISCNSTTNNFCVCNTGYYYHSKSQNPMTQYEGDCILHSRCPVGEGVKVRGSANNDTKCESCPVGTFSDEESTTAACRSYQNCSAGTVPVGGTRKTDVSCKPKGSEDNNPPVAAIVIPILVVICVIAFIGIIIYIRKRKKKKDTKKTNSPDGNTDTQNGSYTSIPAAEAPSEARPEAPSEARPEAPSEARPEAAPPEAPSEAPSEPPASLPSNGVDTTEPKPRPKVPWDEVNRFLSAKLCGTQDYRMALRSIMSQSKYQYGEALITEHTTNNPKDVKEMIYQVLCDWTKKSRRPTLDNVIKGLEEQNMHMIVTELKQHKSVKPFLDDEQATS
ncbi:tumor necrosis factor receptor superfamily member 5-like isoform X2 [Mizuhopecten yessoensis]|uniref:tumor necrosis factor receptor superfamily member 5-like isoform X2 n=1 Tax=Mizuhopecten yessoensis TaxID=6573 RepID=UPI000B45A0BE|nr:tumor necrosis factor receptor superfamily member 5-like isoform X2 [Mizuhopecten yessoensis]